MKIVNLWGWGFPSKIFLIISRIFTTQRKITLYGKISGKKAICEEKIFNRKNRKSNQTIITQNWHQSTPNNM